MFQCFFELKKQQHKETWWNSVVDNQPDDTQK